MDKKPDHIVFNQETNNYDAYLRPYPTNLTAPKIEPNDMVSWKRSNLYSVNNHFKSKFEELKEEYQKLLDSFRDNDTLYGVKYNFEPIVGNTYHLYKKDSDHFLSILAPEECNFSYVGSYLLNSDKLWQKVVNND